VLKYTGNPYSKAFKKPYGARLPKEAAAAASGFADFTAGMTEVDTENDLTVTANELAFAYVDGHEAYRYWDGGAAYFDEDWDIDFVLNIASGDHIIAYLMLFANEVNNANVVDGHDNQGIKIQASSTYFKTALRQQNTQTNQTAEMALNPDYFCTYLRDDDQGTYGRHTLNIYTDEARTVLFESIHMDCSAKYDWRYLYLFNGLFMTAETDEIAGSISDMKMSTPSLP